MIKFTRVKIIKLSKGTALARQARNMKYKKQVIATKERKYKRRKKQILLKCT